MTAFRGDRGYRVERRAPSATCTGCRAPLWPEDICRVFVPERAGARGEGLVVWQCERCAPRGPAAPWARTRGEPE